MYRRLLWDGDPVILWILAYSWVMEAAQRIRRHRMSLSPEASLQRSREIKAHVTSTGCNPPST